MGSYLLHDIEPLKNVVIPVNTYETRSGRQSFSGLKEAINHLKEGHCLGIFPVGEEASCMEISRTILVNRIEKIIMDMEPGYRLPVLLRKYFEINGRILCFNVDPKFNYCLDCLMLLDLYKTPPEFIKGLSRQMSDPSILERFSDKISGWLCYYESICEYPLIEFVSLVNDIGIPSKGFISFIRTPHHEC